MGRRSISTTKSGKFMNPTDQARKEARKKELKKNKKQRQMVRAAVLKGKDPNQLIAEMEKIDRMEYDVTQPPVLNEKVLKDKRKKLKETFERVLKLYEKEDPPQWVELKRLEHDYDKRRTTLVQYYESVKHAQQVQVDDIPLPAVQMPSMVPSHIPLPSDIPLPSQPTLQPASILKKVSSYTQKPYPKMKKPPGVPPGLPPPLSDDEEEDDTEDLHIPPAEPMDVDRDVTEKEPKDISDDKNSGKSRKIRFVDENEEDNDDETEEEKDTRLKAKKSPSILQAKMLAMAGQDINEFLKEMELAHRQSKGDKSTIEENGAKDKSKSGDDDTMDIPIPPPLLQPSLPPGPPPGLPPGPPPNMPLPPGPPPVVPGMMFRPPPLRPGMPPPLRLPPGPPPGRPGGPPGPPPGLPPRMAGPPMRLPPGPPPGMPPPRLLRPPGLPLPGMPLPPGINQALPAATSNPNVLSAPPSLISRPKLQDDDKKNMTTIEAKPQIRNLSADVTRFTPTSLRVKREDKGSRKKDQKIGPGPKIDEIVINIPKTMPSMVPTKDDAYEQFLREMEGLL